MRVATSTVRVWTKQLRREDLNALGQCAMDAAFPKFLPSVPSPETERRAADLATTLDFVWLKREPERRFAGDESLPHGRYSSICRDREGDDGGTLRAELAAYADPNHCVVTVQDLVLPDRDPLFADAPIRQALLVAFVTAPPLGTPLRQMLSDLGLRHGVLPTVTLPYRVESVEIEGVLDLRTPSAQSWFCDAVIRELRSFKAHDTHRSVLNRLLGRKAQSQTAFLQMLPSLMSGERGGNALTRVVGHWLRSKRVAGLVFPSARKDAGVTVEDGQITRFHGWNLVRLDNAPPHGFETALFSEMIDVSPWCASWGDGVHIAFAEEGAFAGSWQVRGLEASHEGRLQARLKSVVTRPWHEETST